MYLAESSSTRWKFHDVRHFNDHMWQKLSWSATEKARPRNRLGPTAVRVDSQDSGGQSTLRITNRLAAGSQNHEFSIKNSTFRPVSVLFRRSTYSREGTDVNLGQIFKI